MSNHELRIMFREHELISFEEMIHREVVWQDISRDKIKIFLKEADIGIKKIVAHDILTSLNVAHNDKITNAGVLFFAENPRKFILQAQMTLIAFKGKDRIHIFDRQDIQDDLLTQFNGALFFLKKHLNRRSEIKGVNREDIYEIPIEALREAVANAIIHRDYGMRGTSLMVEVYDDRVEIVNPGGLPAGLEKKDFGKISVRRNERIADLFFRMDKVELAGTGLRRMKEAMIAAELPPPRIRQTTFFNISFRRPIFDSRPAAVERKKSADKVTERVTDKVTKKVTENQSLILKGMKKDNQITARILSEIVWISERKIKENIKLLKNKGLLKRIGPARGGHWKVVDG